VTETEISKEEAAIKAELARIGVKISEENDRGVVSFAAGLIAEQSDISPNWRRIYRRLAAHAIAARLAKMSGNKESRDEHFAEVSKHMAWLLKKSVSQDELTRLSRGIGDQMRE